MPEAGAPPAPQAAWRARIESILEAALPPDGGDAIDAPRLHAAMRHAVLGGGKRMRPLLVYATGTALGCAPAALDDVAAAVELVHAYSLVHDDLPAMDDDAMRRGRPTVHVAFDVATAILAGDALQALAFERLAAAPLPDAARVAMLRELATAAGARGMCGGQAIDIEATGTRMPVEALERMHALKTGALLRAAVRLGAIAGAAGPAQHAALDRYADALGLAFQVRDDLLDVEGDSATLGKTAGKDQARAKATFPALLGIEASRERLLALGAQMEAALAPLGRAADALRALAREAIERDR